MRHTLFAFAAATALASSSVRAATPLDTYQGNLSVQALDESGNIIPISSMTPGNIVATSGWEISANQVLNGAKSASIAYCGIATNGVNVSLAAGALTNIVCGDGSTPVATWGSNGSFAATFLATCTYLSGDWTSLYYSPTSDVVHMPKQQSACNGSTNIRERFHNGGNSANYAMLEIESADIPYLAGIIAITSFNQSNAFPATIYNAEQQPARPDMAALMAAQRLVGFNNH